MRSPIPSPLMADVGTSGMYSLKLTFSQNKAPLIPYMKTTSYLNELLFLFTCSANSVITVFERSSNSSLVFCFCFLMASRMPEVGFLLQSNSRSIYNPAGSDTTESKAWVTLFNATTKGTFFFFNKFSDSIVCGSRPCIKSTTRIAISHIADPRIRKLLQNINVII